MASRLNPYLSFKRNAREAMEFYKSVFGGELTVSPFGDLAHAPDERDLVMHSQLVVDNGYWLMGSDTPANMGEPGPNGTVSLSGEDAALQGYWDKLSAGGNVVMPLNKAPWGDSFGMLVDKFGTTWMVNITGQQ